MRLKRSLHGTRATTGVGSLSRDTAGEHGICERIEHLPWDALDLHVAQDTGWTSSHGAEGAVAHEAPCVKPVARSATTWLELPLVYTRSMSTPSLQLQLIFVQF